MKNYQEIYNFIKDHYKHSRFEGRNNKAWGEDYSHNIVKASICELKKHGMTGISRHESVTGEAITFDCNLNIIDTDWLYKQLKAFKKDMISKGYPLTDKHIKIFKEIFIEACQHDIKSNDEMDNFIKQGLLAKCDPTDIYFSGEEGKQYVTNQVKQLLEKGE